jgi:hypothetical protein
MSLDVRPVYDPVPVEVGLQACDIRLDPVQIDNGNGSLVEVYFEHVRSVLCAVLWAELRLRPIA